MLRSAMVVLLVAPILALGADKDPVEVEREKLQGTWVLVQAFKRTGEELAPEDIADNRTTFKGETMTNRPPNLPAASFQFTLDPGHSPKAINMVMKGGLLPLLGIYRLDGDTLEVAWTAGGSQIRPKELAPCPEDSAARWSYAIYHREKTP